MQINSKGTLPILPPPKKKHLAFLLQSVCRAPTTCRIRATYVRGYVTQPQPCKGYPTHLGEGTNCLLLHLPSA